MKKLVEKFGLDKITHFLAGFAIACTINTVLVLQDGMCGDWMALPLCLSGTTVASLIGLLKETGIDKVPDKKDFIATVIGAVASVVPFAIGVLFNVLSE